MTQHSLHYLPAGLQIPGPEPDGLSKPYWEGLKAGRLMIQRCSGCGLWQWGPEWICHSCHSFELAWEGVTAEGRIYSWERVWHAVHPALFRLQSLAVGSGMDLPFLPWLRSRMGRGQGGGPHL